MDVISCCAFVIVVLHIFLVALLPRERIMHASFENCDVGKIVVNFPTARNVFAVIVGGDFALLLDMVGFAPMCPEEIEVTTVYDIQT